MAVINSKESLYCSVHLSWQKFLPNSFLQVTNFATLWRSGCPPAVLSHKTGPTKISQP